jgi:Glycosyl hydrolase family 10
MVRSGFKLALALGLVAAAAPAGRGQVVGGAWVKEADQRVNSLRKASLRVLVLDAAGQPAPAAKVHVAMRRHVFPFGVRLDPLWFAPGETRDRFDDAPVWRAFSAVSLDAATGWPTLQPAMGRWEFRRTEQMLDWAQERGMAVRWGAVLSADAGRAAPWAAGLDGTALRVAVEQHLHEVLTRFGRRVGQFDLLANSLDHRWLSERLGGAIERRLFQLAGAVAPHANVGVQFDDTLTGERLQRMVRRVTELKEAFVPIDYVSIQARLNGTVTQSALARSLGWVGDLNVPIVVTGLEVGGPSPAAAAINIETVLRVLFADEHVRGVWLAGVAAERLSDPSAALVAKDGQPTPAGAIFDKMVRRVWWTDETATADRLGNVRLRVFAGLYEVSATLADGSMASTQVFLPPGSEEKLVVIQPLKADK